MSARNRSEPMILKHFSRAGLMLTDWCNAACASCYLCCRPEQAAWMDVDFALDAWEQLQSASPHGCRVHISGGEPFGDFPRMLSILRGAMLERLGPLESVETNAFWATDERIIRDRLRRLSGAGMRTLAISADPFHQQFVPIDRPRRLASVAEEQLGASRVKVRWADWLAEGGDVRSMEESKIHELFARWAAGGRDRLNGRAAERLAPLLKQYPLDSLPGGDCREALLRGKHVHIGPEGWVMPGVCAGIVLGNLREETLREMRQRLIDESLRGAPTLVNLLSEQGPKALLAHLSEEDDAPRPVSAAGRCELCWRLRKRLGRRPDFAPQLGPDWIYQADLADG